MSERTPFENLLQSHQELRRPVDSAYQVAKNVGLINASYHRIDVDNFFNDFLTSNEFRDQRDRLKKLGQLFPFHDLSHLAITDSLPQETVEASIYRSFEHRTDPATRTIDAETGVFLDNVINTSLAFCILEAAISQDDFEKAASLFEKLGELKRTPRWKVSRGNLVFDPYEQGEQIQGAFYRMQLQKNVGRDPNKFSPPTLEFFLRPGYYKASFTVNRYSSSQELLGIGLEDAEEAPIKEMLEVVNLYKIIPGKQLPRIQIPKVSRPTQIDFFRTPRLSIASSPTYPQDTRRNLEDVRVLKIGIVRGQLVSSFATEANEQVNRMEEIPLDYLHQTLPLIGVSRHIQEGRINPYFALGYHINQLASIMKLNSPDYIQSLFNSIHQQRHQSSQ